MDRDERMSILDQLEKGEMSPGEAAAALERDPEAILEALGSPMEVLEAVESGTITPDEAAQKLGEKEQDEGPSSAAAEAHAAAWAQDHWSSEAGDDVEWPEESRSKMVVISDTGQVNLGFLWPSTLATGVVFILLSALWMANRLTIGAGLDLWFFVAWVPMLIGLLLTTMGWASIARPWLKLRVRSKSEAERVQFQFGFPLPMKAIRWLVRQAGERSGQFDYLDVDAMLYKMEQGVSDEPIRILVDNDDEKVEIQIGYTE